MADTSSEPDVAALMAQFQLLMAEMEKMKKENEELRIHVKLADHKEGDGAAQSSDNPIPSKGRGKLVEEDNEGGPSGEADVVSKKRRTKPAEPPMPTAFDGKKSLSEFEILMVDMDAYLKFLNEDTWFEFAECRLVGDARTWQTTQLEDLFQRLEDAKGTRAQNYNEQLRKFMRPVTNGGTSYKPYSSTGNQPKFFGGKPRSQYQHQRTFSGNKGGTRPSGGQRTTTIVNSIAGSNKTGGAIPFPTGPMSPVASMTVICFNNKPGHYARECSHASTIAAIVAAETDEMEEEPVGEDTTLEEMEKRWRQKQLNQSLKNLR
ncbi:hypothetical protein R1sor_023676 [Riccia sorocarpa]|uniref:CCHC-type domain-containing protein n=1 Tax=Riccia sorocarpa TaxID=122646 RepID=A0ABD3GRJ4_9MARC